MKRFSLFCVGLCLIVAVATACGPSTNASPATAEITISGMNFGNPLTVPAGAQISVTNKDTMEHSVTSDTNGQFNLDVEGNEAKMFTAPNQPGQYPFHCAYHPNMKGTLIVQ